MSHPAIPPRVAEAYPEEEQQQAAAAAAEAAHCIRPGHSDVGGADDGAARVRKQHPVATASRARSHSGR